MYTAQPDYSRNIWFYSRDKQKKVDDTHLKSISEWSRRIYMDACFGIYILRNLVENFGTEKHAK